MGNACQTLIVGCPKQLAGVCSAPRNVGQTGAPSQSQAINGSGWLARVGPTECLQYLRGGMGLGRAGPEIRVAGA